MWRSTTRRRSATARRPVAREHKVTVSQRPRHRVKLVRHSAVPSMEERLLGEALIPLEVECRLGKDGEERRDAEIDGG